MSRLRAFVHVSFIISLSLAAGACDRKTARNPGPPTFRTTNGPLVFEFPAGWYKNPQKHPFDLQCLSPQRQMVTGVFLFKMQDLAEHFTPEKLFEMQISDLRSKRNNFHLVSAKTVQTMPEKTVTTVVYSGENKAARNYYRFSLIQFTQHPELVAIVLQTAFPSNWEEHRPILAEITRSAQVEVASKAAATP